MPTPLAALARALTLPVHPPAGWLDVPHVVFRGHLAAFHARLDECRVAHEVTAGGAAGGVLAVAIAGLVVERGELGGVWVREEVGGAGAASGVGPASTGQREALAS
jgi:hypothetical protein